MSPELAAVAFGLLSALSWGAGDFNGGLATRRTSVIGVVFVSHLSGWALLLALALLTGEPVPPVRDMVWGGAGGLAGLVGLVALYRALASGHMGIAAPVSGVLTAALPVLFSIGARGLPDAEQLLGFVLAFVAIWLVSFARSGGRGTANVGMALLAGFGFGVFFILLDQIHTNAVFWPLVAARTLSTGTMAAVLLANRRVNLLPQQRGLLALVLLSSALDVAGNVFFLVATQAGRLDIAAVVSSLYPASTLLLARLFLKEHLSRLQFVGVLTALVAIVLITL
ncbi:MAG: DMT family transporter [Chloroflexi bacterium]|nr:DMT family transporter [Chloroflexota bacterium]